MLSLGRLALLLTLIFFLNTLEIETTYKKIETQAIASSIEPLVTIKELW